MGGAVRGMSTLVLSVLYSDARIAILLGIHDSYDRLTIMENIPRAGTSHILSISLSYLRSLLGSYKTAYADLYGNDVLAASIPFHHHEWHEIPANRQRVHGRYRRTALRSGLARMVRNVVCELIYVPVCSLYPAADYMIAMHR